MTTRLAADAPGPIGDFWRAFCAAHAVDAAAARVDVFHFGTADMADRLAALVCIGQKRATAGLAADFEEGGEPAPLVGGYFIVTSAAAVPVAVARTVQVDRFAFRDVPAWFAEREGEDEGTGEACLASWKAGHGKFFRHACAEEGRSFDEGETVICESFDTLHVRADWRAHLVLP
jgi:uncharacterized protein YhfF